MKVRLQSLFPIDVLLKLVPRSLRLGPVITVTHSRGYVFTGTLIDDTGVVYKWKWRPPLVARNAYLRGWVPDYLFATWFGFTEVSDSSRDDVRSYVYFGPFAGVN